MTKIFVCSIHELPSGTARKTGTDPDIAVFNIHDTLYAVADLCTHAVASLSEGYIEEDEVSVECPIHSARFCLKSGKALCLPASEDVKTYAVERVGTDIYVDLPEG
jgi:3-phenylpropionate/trans-cinnamate dioxygenase ferredoxin subunit